MAKRRAGGEGNIRRRANGRWEGRIVAGHNGDGAPIFRYVYADTQKELMRKLHQVIHTYQGIELTEESRMTLSDWLDRWLEEMAATLRPNTLEGYRGDMERHVKPMLGQKPLDKLTPEDLRHLYDALLDHGRKDGKGGLAPASVHGIHTTLHHALKTAAEERLIPSNPADQVVPPKIEKRPMNILSSDQLETFLDTIQSDEIWLDFFYTELTTGLRRGEICGLQWGDFDEVSGTLKVSRTIHTRKGGTLAAGDTKTYAGTRKLLLPPSTAELLKKRKKTALTKWIFPNPLKPGEPVNPNSAYRRLKELLAQAGLPNIRFHDLRHTFATHALAAGVDPKTLSSILGHTKASFTVDTYTHFTGEMQKNAARLVGNFMTDILGEEWKPWESARQVPAASI